MTSNIGSRQLKDFGTGVGFNTSARKTAESEYARGVIENALKKSFAPEFINRIDDIVIFENLEREDIHKIIDIELNRLFERISKMKFRIEVTEQAKDFISDKGWDPQFGARPLKRAIQRYIEDQLAEEIIKSIIDEGDQFIVDLNDDKSDISIRLIKASGERLLSDVN